MTEVAKLVLAPQSTTPPNRANQASPRASQLAAMFCDAAMADKKELETLRSDADDSPSEPDRKLHLHLQVTSRSSFAQENENPTGGLALHRQRCRSTDCNVRLPVLFCTVLLGGAVNSRAAGDR
jgi:hypothetical protein